MRVWMIVLATVITTHLWFPTTVLAQRNFSRRQQAAMYSYMSRIQQTERTRQEAMTRRIQTQMRRQQEEINSEANRREELFQYGTTDPLTGEAVPIPPRLTRRASYFGTAHRGSPMFGRLNPYYDYAFIHQRNRESTNLGATMMPTGSAGVLGF